MVVKCGKCNAGQLTGCDAPLVEVDCLQNQTATSSTAGYTLVQNTNVPCWRKYRCQCFPPAATNCVGVAWIADSPETFTRNVPGEVCPSGGG